MKTRRREPCELILIPSNRQIRSTLWGMKGLIVNRALFTRALAELKYLGMVKNSKKKADHLTKICWKGL